LPIARTIWLIALTLVATLLPASARLAPAKAEKPKPADEQAQPSAPVANKPESNAENPEKKSEEHKSPKHAKVAPNPDLWDGGSTRLVSGGSGKIIIAAFLRHDAGSRIASVNRHPIATAISTIPCGLSQLSRLTCRNAHAPPIAI